MCTRTAIVRPSVVWVVIGALLSSVNGGAAVSVSAQAQAAKPATAKPTTAKPAASAPERSTAWSQPTHASFRRV